jgi:D-inositol-3-phosphate glycosyltransferase
MANVNANHNFPIGSYCSSTTWGGLEMNVLRFLHWMNSQGWPVFLYAPSDTVVAQHADEFGVPLRDVRIGSELSALWKARGLARAVSGDGVQVLIVHQSRDLLPCALAKAFFGDFRLVYSQNMHLGNKRDPIHAWQYQKLEAFVAPLPVLAEQAQRQTVVPPEKIHVIAHGIEQERFTGHLDKTEMRRLLGLPREAIVIGIIGRLDPKKGQHVGIKALARVHARGMKAHLLIIGIPTLHEGSEYQAHLTNLVSELGLVDYVHFRDFVERPERAYAAMDIFVLTSQSETYGLVTIEAMTSGLPVIGTDSGGTVDIIDHERNGLRFAPDDEGALSAALMRYLTDAGFAARLASQGRQDALRRYSHTMQCEEWEKLLRMLVRQGGSRRQGYGQGGNCDNVPSNK